MAYEFAGFFARPQVPRPAVLPPGAEWRTITTPFDGVGVHLPALHGEQPAVETVEALARQLGHAAAHSWLYLTYTCWGGAIDSVYGFGKSDDRGPIGPVNESDWDKVRQAYLTLMAHFGLSADDALDFEPFRRGFWTDT